MVDIKFEIQRITTAEKYIEDFAKDVRKEFLQEQVKAIVDFDGRNAANDLSILTRRDYIIVLKQLAKAVKKPFDRMAKEDIGRYLDKVNNSKSPYTALTTKIKIKRFFKVLGRPDLVDWISTRMSGRHHKPVKQILSAQERGAMLKVCTNQRDRAILSFLDQTGCRAQELILTKIKDIELDTNGRFMRINLGKGKTGRRRVVITEGVGDIQLWLNLHPLKDNPDAPLAVSFAKKYLHRVLQPPGLNIIVNRVAKDAGIKRKVHPHLFRHTRCWILMKEKGWNEVKTRIFLGWEKNSQMTALYANMTDDDVGDLVLQEAGIKTRSEMEKMDIKDKECSRCRSKNPFDAKYCNICSLALDSKIAEKHVKIIKVSDEIMDISQENNIEIEKAVEKYVEKIKMKIISELKAGKGNLSSAVTGLS